jgi:hypothetical protein
MALTDENMVMPVTPMNYGNNNGGFGFGGDWAWILLLLVLGGGWGGFSMGGFGGAAMAMDGGFGLYPWLNNSQNINDGFRDQQLSNQVGNIQNSVTSGFGDVQNALCSGFGNVQNSLCAGFAGVNASINGAQNALTQQLYTNQISDLERSFAAQTANTQGMTSIQAQLAQCCCDNRAATADLKYTVATENCADRYEAAQNTRDIIESQTRSTQAILDKLCALELDGVKAQVAAEQRENANLRTELMYSRGQASQVAQTAQILAGQNAEVDALYNRLKNCPVNAVPVYGSQPIFTCPNNNGCGCGNNF